MREHKFQSLYIGICEVTSFVEPPGWTGADRRGPARTSGDRGAFATDRRVMTGADRREPVRARAAHRIRCRVH